MQIKDKRKPNRLFLSILLTCALLFSIQGRTTDSYFEISKNLDIFTNVFKELNNYYVDPIEPGKLVQKGIDAMLSELDPYTNYITESDIEDFEFQTTGKYGGIGTTMRSKKGSIFVGAVYENTPAQKAGLHPGDEILKIDGKSTAEKSIEDISVLLKGAPGTKLTITVKDAYTGLTSDKMIVRGEIELSSVPYASLLGDKKDIAYVKLTQFTPGCSKLVKDALDSLKGVNNNLSSVLLDLRDNPGGLLSEAVEVCNLFLDKGQQIVSTKGKMESSDQDFLTKGKPWNTQIPVAVLINHGSASASEIVSGTIQDLDRGIVVGERSYGKGLVQITRPLGYNARIKLTTAKYYTPSGRCIQALDYAHRNDDGSVGKVPDSLKKEYKTANGRIVRSGGGVAPDVKISDEHTSKLAATIYYKGYFFDYATQYAKNHKTIAPAYGFQLTDKEYNEFAKWLSTKEYDYKTETEIVLDSLKETAMREEYFDEIKPAYEQLTKKLSHDKQQDLIKHKKQISFFLESEIVSRYYYLGGRIAHGLAIDKDVEKAVNLLQKPTDYNALLKPATVIN